MSKAEDAKVKALQDRIRRDPATMVRVLRVIWSRQSEGEQFTHVYDPREGGQQRGFSPDDTPFCNYLHEKLEDNGFKWQELKALDVARGQRVVPKYARQFRRHERERRDAELEASRQFLDEAFARQDEARRARTRKTWGDGAVTS